MPDGLSFRAVFAELIDQFAGQYEIEKLVHLFDDCRVGGVLPRLPPKHCEHFHIS
jgi:hypothetical protein